MANLFWPKVKWQSSTKRAQKRDQERVAAAKRAGKMLIISHGHCLDGIASAAIASRVEPDSEVIYCQPNHLNNVFAAISRVPGEGRTLLISDLSLQRNEIDSITASCQELASAGWKIMWLDHHHKQWEGLNLKRLTKTVDLLTVDFDAAESGATLVQQQFAPGDAVAKALAETVRDRDLWWNKNPDSERLEFALTDLGAKKMFEHFVGLEDAADIAGKKIQDAAAREEARQEREAGKVLRTTKRYGEAPDEVAIVYGWLPRNTGLHTLIEQGVAVAINIRPNGKMSLRSRKDADICHKIAGQFGGGGHPNASGGDLKLKGRSYWWYILRRGRTQIHRDLAKVALAEMQSKRESK